VTDDAEEPDLTAVYERGAALRERLRIAEIIEFGKTTDRLTSALGLALRTEAPAWLAIELLQLQVTDVVASSAGAEFRRQILAGGESRTTMK
jgi:hypothetical protein